MLNKTMTQFHARTSGTLNGAVLKDEPVKVTYKGSDHVLIIPIANGIPPELEKYLERLDNGK